MWTSPVPQLRLLFFDKCLIARRGPVLRGVEQFNLTLLEDLLAQGVQLTLLAHTSWHERLQAQLPGIHLLGVSATPWTLLSSLLAALHPHLGRHDVLFISNCARDLILAVWCLHLRRSARWRILMVHRWPSRRVRLSWRRCVDQVITVNNIIAAQFRQYGYPRVTCYFGENRPDRFQQRRSRPPGARLKFCVPGALHTPLKGAETAITAFRGLPADLQSRCELHLLGYHGTLPDPEPGIVYYPWQEATAIADFLAQMDVVIIPSHQETFCLAMVQGMLSGLPVLARNIPVLAEKLRDGGGWLFEDAISLRQHMAQLIDNRALCQSLGDATRAQALTHYCWSSEVFWQRFVAPHV